MLRSDHRLLSLLRLESSPQSGEMFTAKQSLVTSANSEMLGVSLFAEKT